MKRGGGKSNKEVASSAQTSDLDIASLSENEKRSLKEELKGKLHLVHRELYSDVDNFIRQYAENALELSSYGGNMVNQGLINLAIKINDMVSKSSDMQKPDKKALAKNQELLNEAFRLLEPDILREIIPGASAKSSAKQGLDTIVLNSRHVLVRKEILEKTQQLENIPAKINGVKSDMTLNDDAKGRKIAGLEQSGKQLSRDLGALNREMETQAKIFAKEEKSLDEGLKGLLQKYYQTNTPEQKQQNNAEKTQAQSEVRPKEQIIAELEAEAAKLFAEQKAGQELPEVSSESPKGSHIEDTQSSESAKGEVVYDETKGAEVEAALADVLKEVNELEQKLSQERRVVTGGVVAQHVGLESRQQPPAVEPKPAQAATGVGQTALDKLNARVADVEREVTKLERGGNVEQAHIQRQKVVNIIEALKNAGIETPELNSKLESFREKITAKVIADTDAAIASVAEFLRPLPETSNKSTENVQPPEVAKQAVGLANAVPEKSFEEIIKDLDKIIGTSPPGKVARSIQSTEVKRENVVPQRIEEPPKGKEEAIQTGAPQEVSESGKNTGPTKEEVIESLRKFAAGESEGEEEVHLGMAASSMEHQVIEEQREDASPRMIEVPITSSKRSEPQEDPLGKMFNALRNFKPNDMSSKVKDIRSTLQNGVDALLVGGHYRDLQVRPEDKRTFKATERLSILLVNEHKAKTDLGKSMIRGQIRNHIKDMQKSGAIENLNNFVNTARAEVSQERTPAAKMR